MPDNGEPYFNPFDPAFRANPYPHYVPLRSGPPHILKLFIPIVMMARYDDVVAVLKDHERFSSNRPKRLLVNEGYGDVKNMLTTALSDPPEHTRIRKAAAPIFTPKRIQEWEARIREITNGLLDKVEERGTFDAIEDLADPLPVMVLSEIFGIPPEDYPQYKAWSDIITDSVHIMPGVPLPQEIRNAFTEIRAYFRGLIEKRRTDPHRDLLSHLITQTESDKLGDDEMLDFTIMQLVAGTDTTTNMIGNGFHALTRYRDQVQLLRQQPSLISTAVEEVLRFDGPIQAIGRFAKEDVEVGGTTVRKNSVAFVLLASANRDPAQFRNPDTFDITRNPNSHMAFGAGIHFCIGAPLGRLEGIVAFEETLKRFPNLRLADPDRELQYRDFYFIRGLKSLPLEI